MGFYDDILDERLYTPSFPQQEEYGLSNRFGNLHLNFERKYQHLLRNLFTPDAMDQDYDLGFAGKSL